MITARGLTRRYGGFTALDTLDLDIASGSICALLGPNGAGKSTTLKLLTGLLAPTSGSACVVGFDPWHDATALKRAIGVLPEGLGLFDALTVMEHLELCAGVHGLSKQEGRMRATQLLRVLGLEHGQNTFASECSHGMRKKTALAMALLHNPQALFLDEPFEGIDPVCSRAIANILTMLAGRGVTVFLTSHILSITEKLATQLVFINSGRTVWQGTPAELPTDLEQHYFDLVEAPPEEELAWLGQSSRS